VRSRNQNKNWSEKLMATESIFLNQTEENGLGKKKKNPPRLMFSLHAFYKLKRS